MRKFIHEAFIGPGGMFANALGKGDSPEIRGFAIACSLVVLLAVVMILVSLVGVVSAIA